MKCWGKVAIGARCGKSPDPLFHQSWTELICTGLESGDEIIKTVSESPHHHAAESLVKTFLASKADSLLMLDDDMVFKGDDLRELRSQIEGFNYGILQALTIARVDGFPAVIIKDAPDGVCTLGGQVDSDTVMDVDCVGLAFTLIRREVFEEIAKIKPQGEMFFTWGKDGSSEEVEFCRLAQLAGFKLGVSTHVSIGHRMKMVVQYNLATRQIDYRMARSWKASTRL